MELITSLNLGFLFVETIIFLVLLGTLIGQYFLKKKKLILLLFFIAFGVATYFIIETFFHLIQICKFGFICKITAGWIFFFLLLLLFIYKIRKKLSKTLLFFIIFFAFILVFFEIIEFFISTVFLSLAQGIVIFLANLFYALLIIKCVSELK